MTTRPSGGCGRSGTNRARVRILRNFVLGGLTSLIILGAAWSHSARGKNGQDVAPSSPEATISRVSHRPGYPRWEDWCADARTLAAMVRYLLEPESPAMEESAP